MSQPGSLPTEFFPSRIRKSSPLCSPERTTSQPTTGACFSAASSAARSIVFARASGRGGAKPAAGYTLIPDAREVEEICEDAFAEAWRNLGALRTAAAFGGWVRKIARRLALRRIRARTAARTKFGHAESGTGTGSGTDDQPRAG